MRIQLFIIAVVASMFIPKYAVFAQDPSGYQEKQSRILEQPNKKMELLTPVEKKYQIFLPLINRMKAEHAGSYENSLNLARKYSNDAAFWVDDRARIRMIIFLSPDASFS